MDTLVRQRSIFHRTMIVASGWLLVIVGIAGLVLPFVQGILFLVLGFSLLSIEYAWASRVVIAIKRRLPGSAKSSSVQR